MKPERFQKSPPREARKNKHVTENPDAPELSEAALITLVSENTNALILILDGVTDPHNLGACLRSASAAGAIAVIAPKDRSAPLTETVHRVACGGSQTVPYVRVTNLARALRHLRDTGMWITGTSDQSEKSIYDMDLTGRLGLVIGAEGDGIRRLTAEHCDFLCHIPMQPGPVACLNVSVAAGICLFEAIRQRSLHKNRPV